MKNKLVITTNRYRSSKWEKTESHDGTNNVVDKYAVCVKKNDTIIGRLPKEPKGRFAKIIFFFHRADELIPAPQ